MSVMTSFFPVFVVPIIATLPSLKTRKRSSFPELVAHLEELQGVLLLLGRGEAAGIHLAVQVDALHSGRGLRLDLAVLDLEHHHGALFLADQDGAFEFNDLARPSRQDQGQKT